MRKRKDITLPAIILSEQDYGEADKRVTVLTPGQGKLTVYCRGVRHLKSRRFAATQLFAYTDMTLEENHGHLYLSEAVLREPFFELRTRLDAFALACYCAELLLAVSMEGEGDPDRMRLCLNTLYLLCKRPELPTAVIKTIFELRLTADMGIFPDLSACADCGRPSLDNEGNAAFEAWLDLSGGVLFCADCAFREKTPDGEEHPLVPLSGGALRLMRHAAAADPKKLFAFSASAEDVDLAGRASERYLTYALGKIPETLTFYRSVQ